jgi:glycosyltransferase involved in cell wall biosynthesis
LSRVFRPGDALRAQAESEMRRVAIARAPGPLLGRMLRRRLPAGTSYLNVGHANLSGRVMQAVRAIRDARIAVLVHDVIPLVHPEFTRPGIGAVFARKMAAVSAGADLVIHSAQTTRADTEAQFAAMGRVPPGVVAPLGINAVAPDASRLPQGLDLATPYFVTIGTIEPRKNHHLLLDVWDRLPGTAQLFIVGSRGWADAALLARLDRLRQPGARVIELSGLDDSAVSALLSGARALLFPTFAEGYGLPPLEAAAQNVPVIVSDLPVLREILQDSAVYLDSRGSYSWLEKIEGLSSGTGATIVGTKTATNFTAPTWAAHFKTVLSLA